MQKMRFRNGNVFSRLFGASDGGAVPPVRKRSANGGRGSGRGLANHVRAPTSIEIQSKCFDYKFNLMNIYFFYLEI